MKMMISSIFIVLLVAFLPVKAESMAPGYIIKKDNGQMMACLQPMGDTVACWDINGPSKQCTPKYKKGDKLLCNVIES